VEYSKKNDKHNQRNPFDIIDNDSSRLGAEYHSKIERKIEKKVKRNLKTYGMLFPKFMNSLCFGRF
jgi:hypothetical protein